MKHLRSDPKGIGGCNVLAATPGVAQRLLAAATFRLRPQVLHGCDPARFT